MSVNVHCLSSLSNVSCCLWAKTLLFEAFNVNGNFLGLNDGIKWLLSILRFYKQNVCTAKIISGCALICGSSSSVSFIVMILARWGPSPSGPGLQVAKHKLRWFTCGTKSSRKNQPTKVTLRGAPWCHRRGPRRHNAERRGLTSACPQIIFPAFFSSLLIPPAAFHPVLDAATMREQINTVAQLLRRRHQIALHHAR